MAYFFKGDLAILGPLYFYMNFRPRLSISRIKKKRLLGWWLCWIYRTTWRETTLTPQSSFRTLCLSEYLRGTLFKSLALSLSLSLSAAFSSPTLCPHTPAALVFPDSQFHLSSSWVSAWTLSQGSELGSPRAHLVLPISQCSLSFTARCSRCSILLFQILCPFKKLFQTGKANLVLVIPSW